MDGKQKKKRGRKPKKKSEEEPKQESTQMNENLVIKLTEPNELDKHNIDSIDVKSYEENSLSVCEEKRLQKNSGSKT